jgi:transposase
MQLQLPLFSKETKLISSCVGVYEHDGLVQYIVNGLPVYSHDKEDLQAFRFITSTLIKQKLCKMVEVEKAFGVSADSVQRNVKKLLEEGESAFFSPDNRHGRSHKIMGALKDRIQKDLDQNKSVNSVAVKNKVTEGAIRYAIKQGYLKKNTDR